MNGAQRVTAIDLLHQDKIWVDGQGVTHQIADMKMLHARNVRDFLLRNGRMLAEQAYARIAFGMQPTGDMACDAVDSMLEELTDAAMSPVPWLERSELLQALNARLRPEPTERVTYVELARRRLVEAFPKLGEAKRRDLLDLYTLLVLVRGEAVTGEDVHDAWAVRMANLRPDHRSLVPYGELPESVRARDDKYVHVIIDIARDLKNA